MRQGVFGVFAGGSPCGLVLILLAQMLLVACARPVGVEVSLSSADGVARMVGYRVLDGGDPVRGGSLVLGADGGRESFHVAVTEQTFVYLFTATPSWETLLLVSPGERVSVELHGGVATITGSAESERLLRLDGALLAFRSGWRQRQLRYERAYLSASPDSLRGVLLEEHREALDSMRGALLDFVYAVPYSKAALVALLAESGTGEPFFPVYEYDSLYCYLLDLQRDVYEPIAGEEALREVLGRLGRCAGPDALAAMPYGVGDTIAPGVYALGEVRDSVVRLAQVGELLWLASMGEVQTRDEALDGLVARVGGEPMQWVRLVEGVEGTVRLETADSGAWSTVDFATLQGDYRAAFASLGLWVTPRSYLVGRGGEVLLVNPSLEELEREVRRFYPRPFWRPRPARPAEVAHE